MTRSRWSWLAMAGLLASGWLLRGCSSSGTLTAAAGSGGAAGASASVAGRGGHGGSGHAGVSGRAGASLAGAAGSSAAGAPGDVRPPSPTTCAGSARPDAIPADWSEWTGWSCECSLLGPGTTGTPYPGIGWEPCELPYASSVVCERHTHPWHAQGFYYIGARPYMRRDPATGHPLVQATHALVNGTSGDRTLFHFVADATTGAMKHVLVQPSVFDCGAGSFGQFEPGGMSAERAVLGHSDRHADPVNGQEGWLDLAFDQPWPAHTIKKDHASAAMVSSWHGSQLGVLRNINTASLADWDGQHEQAIFSSALDIEGRPSFTPFITDSAVFFPVGGLVGGGISVWSKTTGIQPLLRWPGDFSRVAANLGTDGQDLVWVYGEGKTVANEDPYPTLSVMTAPYSLDPATVAKTTRRLRSQPGFIDGWRYQVGCGYAARSVSVNDGKTFNGLFIVRLSDGVSWTLPGAPNVGDLGWNQTLYVDCEHVYVHLSGAGKVRIGRVRLDSLGPGTPPD